MKNLILVDFIPPKEWEFKNGLEESTREHWDVYSVTNNSFGSKIDTIVRYFKYFYVAFKVFIKRDEYKTILAWQQFYGIVLAFFCRLFKVKNAPKIVVMTLIYKDKTSLFGKIYKRFIYYCVSSGYIKKYIVFSKNECEYYANLFNLENKYYEYISLGIEDKSKDYNIEDRGYYLSAGRSNRDYSFLINSWNDERLEIICDSLDANNSNKNIFILKQCHGAEYLEKLARCHAVIIPLDNQNISSGQLVLLESMMFGKPIICTSNKGIYDYVDNYETGIIIEKKTSELKDAMLYLQNNNNYKRISKRSKDKFEICFGEHKMGKDIGEIISHI